LGDAAPRGVVDADQERHDLMVNAMEMSRKGCIAWMHLPVVCAANPAGTGPESSARSLWGRAAMAASVGETSRSVELVNHEMWGAAGPALVQRWSASLDHVTESLTTSTIFATSLRIVGLCQNGFVKEALREAETLSSFGVPLSPFALTALLESCSGVSRAALREGARFGKHASSLAQMLWACGAGLAIARVLLGAASVSLEDVDLVESLSASHTVREGARAFAPLDASVCEIGRIEYVGSIQRAMGWAPTSTDASALVALYGRAGELAACSALFWAVVDASSATPIAKDHRLRAAACVRARAWQRVSPSDITDLDECLALDALVGWGLLPANRSVGEASAWALRGTSAPPTDRTAGSGHAVHLDDSPEVSSPARVSPVRSVGGILFGDASSVREQRQLLLVETDGEEEEAKASIESPRPTSFLKGIGVAAEDVSPTTPRIAAIAPKMGRIGGSLVPFSARSTPRLFVNLLWAMGAAPQHALVTGEVSHDSVAAVEAALRELCVETHGAASVAVRAVDARLRGVSDASSDGFLERALEAGRQAALVGPSRFTVSGLLGMLDALVPPTAWNENHAVWSFLNVSWARHTWNGHARRGLSPLTVLHWSLFEGPPLPPSEMLAIGGPRASIGASRVTSVSSGALPLPVVRSVVGASSWLLSSEPASPRSSVGLLAIAAMEHRIRHGGGSFMHTPSQHSWLIVPFPNLDGCVSIPLERDSRESTVDALVVIPEESSASPEDSSESRRTEALRSALLHGTIDDDMIVDLEAELLALQSELADLNSLQSRVERTLSDLEHQAAEAESHSDAVREAMVMAKVVRSRMARGGVSQLSLRALKDAARTVHEGLPSESFVELRARVDHRVRALKTVLSRIPPLSDSSHKALKELESLVQEEATLSKTLASLHVRCERLEEALATALHSFGEAKLRAQAAEAAASAAEARLESASSSPSSSVRPQRLMHDTPSTTVSHASTVTLREEAKRLRAVADRAVQEVERLEPKVVSNMALAIVRAQTQRLSQQVRHSDRKSREQDDNACNASIAGVDAILDSTRSVVDKVQNRIRELTKMLADASDEVSVQALAVEGLEETVAVLRRGLAKTRDDDVALLSAARSRREAAAATVRRAQVMCGAVRVESMRDATARAREVERRAGHAALQRAREEASRRVHLARDSIKAMFETVPEKLHLAASSELDPLRRAMEEREELKKQAALRQEIAKTEAMLERVRAGNRALELSLENETTACKTTLSGWKDPLAATAGLATADLREGYLSYMSATASEGGKDGTEAGSEAVAEVVRWWSDVALKPRKIDRPEAQVLEASCVGTSNEWDLSLHQDLLQMLDEQAPESVEWDVAQEAVMAWKTAASWREETPWPGSAGEEEEFDFFSDETSAPRASGGGFPAWCLGESLGGSVRGALALGAAEFAVVSSHLALPPGDDAESARSRALVQVALPSHAALVLHSWGHSAASDLECLLLHQLGQVLVRDSFARRGDWESALRAIAEAGGLPTRVPRGVWPPHSELGERASELGADPLFMFRALRTARERPSRRSSIVSAVSTRTPTRGGDALPHSPRVESPFDTAVRRAKESSARQSDRVSVPPVSPRQLLFLEHSSPGYMRPTSASVAKMERSTSRVK
jgi:hypothetical protein